LIGLRIFQGIVHGRSSHQQVFHAQASAKRPVGVEADFISGQHDCAVLPSCWMATPIHRTTPGNNFPHPFSGGGMMAVLRQFRIIHSGGMFVDIRLDRWAVRHLHINYN